MTDPDQCVLAGTWLYDTTVECRVEIWRRSFRPGTGDYEDPPEISDDQPGVWYEIQFLPPAGASLRQTGGGYHGTLEIARERVRTLTNDTVRWDR